MPDPAPEPRGGPGRLTARRVSAPDSASPPGQSPNSRRQQGGNPADTATTPARWPAAHGGGRGLPGHAAAGLASVNPSSPELAALIDAGATADALADAAARAVDLGKGFAYALGMVRGQMADGPRGGCRGWRGVGAAGPRQPPEPAWRAEQRQRTAGGARHRREKSGDTAKNFIETEVPNMSLPLPWADRIFEKLTLVYGQAFLARWRDLDLDAVKADWAHELDGFERHPKAIAHALQRCRRRSRPRCCSSASWPGAPLPELPWLASPPTDAERVAAELARSWPRCAPRRRRRWTTGPGRGAFWTARPAASG